MGAKQYNVKLCLYHKWNRCALSEMALVEEWYVCASVHDAKYPICENGTYDARVSFELCAVVTNRYRFLEIPSRFSFNPDDILDMPLMYPPYIRTDRTIHYVYVYLYAYKMWFCLLEYFYDFDTEYFLMQFLRKNTKLNYKEHLIKCIN